jgi:hypothetical protein
MMTTTNRAQAVWLMRLALLLAAAGAGGCGHASKSLPANYPATVGSWHYNTLDRVDFVERFALSDYQAVVVEPVATHDVALPPADDNTYEPVKEALGQSTDFFSMGVRSGVKKALPVDVSSASAGAGGGAEGAGAGRGEGGAGSEKNLLVRTSVLMMNPGSQAARYWVGFGAGKAETRIKGEIIDGPSGRTLARFEDSKATTGGFLGGGYSGLLEDHLTDMGSNVGVLIGAFGKPK